MASYQLNQPFDRFIKQAKIPSGRGGALTLEHLQPLVDSILDNWNPATFEEQMLVIQSINNKPQMQYNQPYEY